MSRFLDTFRLGNFRLEIRNDVRAGETSGERAAWALLSLDPIVIAAAVLAVEDEHGRLQFSEYDLTLVRGGTATVQSRYVVQPGQCIMMRRPTGVGYVAIVAQDEARCQPSAEPEPPIQ